MNSYMGISDRHMSTLLFNDDVLSLQTQLIDISCCVLTILGLVGNVLGLLIFSSSRHTWHVSSVYVCLATCSSIINLLCTIRYATILHSKTRHLVNESVGHKWFACKMYELSFSFRVMSAWITLFWMFERLTCVSRTLRGLFHQWDTSRMKLIIPIVLILPVLISALGPSVYMYEPHMIEVKLINSTKSTIRYFCGLDPKASIPWQRYFYRVDLGLNHHTIRCLFSEILPAAAVLIFNSSICYHLVQTSHQLSRAHEDHLSKDRRRVMSWMNAVLILHSSLFFVSLLSHIAGHFMAVEAHEVWWVLLSVLANCSLNFYVYCLSGREFRRKIVRFLRLLIIRIVYRVQIRKQQWKDRQRNVEREMQQMKMNRSDFILRANLINPSATHSSV